MTKQVVSNRFQDSQIILVRVKEKDMCNGRTISRDRILSA